MGAMKRMFEDAQFDGATYHPALDQKRLSGQLERVHKLLSDGNWWGLKSLAYAADGSEAAVSARIRDLRKERFGSHVIERRRIAGGLYQYRMMGAKS